MGCSSSEDGKSDVSDFDIEAGEASLTLRELARQANVPFVVSPGLSLDFMTPAVRGRLTSLEAFERLLMNSELYVARHEESGSYVLRSPDASHATSGVTQTKGTNE